MFTIRPINTGFVTMVPKLYLYHHSVQKYYPDASGVEEEFPVFAYLLENESHKILIDTGMADTERAHTYHHPGSHQPEGMSIIEQLSSLGLTPQDIDMVIFTHLHWDHCYYMNQFTNAEFYVNRKEYEFAMDPIPLYYKSYEAPQLGIVRPFEGVEMNLVEGEVEIIPGIRVFETPGHSVGHITVEVDTKDGKYLICGDAVFINDNLKPVKEMHYNITPPNRFANIIEAWRSIELIKERAESEDKILTCHDWSIAKRAEKQPVIG